MATTSLDSVAIYQQLDTLPEIANNLQANLSAARSSGVRPKGLIDTMQWYLDNCEDTELKGKIQTTLNAVTNMKAPKTGDRKHDLFTFFFSKANKKVDFLCLAVSKYLDEDKDELFDYCICTFSYEKMYTEAELREFQQLHAVPGEPSKGILYYIPIFGRGRQEEVKRKLKEIEQTKAKNEKIEEENKHIKNVNRTVEEENAKKKEEFDKPINIAILEACMIYHLVKRGFAKIGRYENVDQVQLSPIN